MQSKLFFLFSGGHFEIWIQNQGHQVSISVEIGQIGK